MEEFLKFIVPLLIDHPEEAVLTKHEGNRKTTFYLRVRQTDIGKIIGKHGQTIIAIRNLLGAAAARHGEKAQLEMVEDAGAAR